ncbi:ketoacyl-ACP synthase III [Exilibacterium tricleocarpae]|uniref:Ketoacyl-ACP synthase III n=1 Tax=Exilibacterium tricleocarpae TaxID=2591008 RepID=A0A545T8G2_9GAMM|nr:ketoacyl-ACP synthase III [Exilibacterium tricleocarpae]TQV73475.1 ketoacyl-ACP synthase III [Exilibacterium tricleocarpae]
MEFIGVSKIAGVGAYLPATVVDSASIMEEIGCERFGVSKSYMDKALGIRERRVCDRDTAPSDLACAASQRAIEAAGIRPEDLGFIVFCGIDRDWQEPATAHRVQSLLGARNASCLDVTNACHGFIDGMAVADAFIAAGMVDNVLVCTGERPSDVMYEYVHKLKKVRSRELFKKWVGMLSAGDAGGAMVIQRSDDRSGWRNLRLCSRGQHAELCHYKRTDKGITGHMLMSEITSAVLDLHEEMIGNTYDRLGWAPGDVDWAYLHQSGSAPHRRMIAAAHLDVSRAPVTYEKFGNLTSATIPVAMALTPPSRGDKLLILGAGSGISVCQGGMIY